MVVVAIGQLGNSLKQPLPMVLHGLRGASLVIDDASLSPPGGTGHFALYGEHVGGLVGRAVGNAIGPTFRRAIRQPPDQCARSGCGSGG